MGFDLQAQGLGQGIFRGLSAHLTYFSDHGISSATQLSTPHPPFTPLFLIDLFIFLIALIIL